MAASSPSVHESADDPAESGAGMAHPTVVPTNFDPEREETSPDET